MTTPTSGSIKYEGKNIFKDMDSFRRKLGLCPQHNLLFPDLTVREHLIFFGRVSYNFINLYTIYKIENDS